MHGHVTRCIVCCLILFSKGPTPKGYIECLSDRIPKTVYSRNEIRDWAFWTDNKSLLTQKITINFNFTDIYAMNNEISAAAMKLNIVCIRTYNLL